MRRYSRSFQRGAGRAFDLGRWPLVEGEDVQGLRVVLDEVGEVAAGAGHRHDRGGQTGSASRRSMLSGWWRASRSSVAKRRAADRSATLPARA